jgi:glucose/arabinose dehydrogenase
MALDKYRMQKTITHLVGGATVVLGGMFILQTVVRIFVDNSALVAVEVGRFEAPTALVGRPGTQDLLLGERSGIVRRIDLAADGSFSSSEEVLDISGEVTTMGEGGLVGLAISPTGDQLYVSYTDKNWLSRIVSYPMDAGGALVDIPRLLLTVAQPHTGHNNGHLLTDPMGRLIIGFGDGGAEQVQDPHGHSRNRNTLLGTLLRILPTPNGTSPYSVPSDNPFVSEITAGVRPEILAFGLRNPWRFDLDSLTGDLWVSDVGHQKVEEINYLESEAVNSGADFGWSIMEGSTELNGPEPDGHVRPVYSYRHDGISYRCSVIGGVVVRGGRLPNLEGTYLFSDYCDGAVRALRHGEEGEVDILDLGITINLPVSFSQLEDGTVYILSLTGGIFRLDPR